jgi:hypothetical protein
MLQKWKINANWQIDINELTDSSIDIGTVAHWIDKLTGWSGIGKLMTNWSTDIQINQFMTLDQENNDKLTNLWRSEKMIDSNEEIDEWESWRIINLQNSEKLISWQTTKKYTQG